MSYTHITPKEAFEKIKEGYIYLDVRTEKEYQDGHAKEAVNIPVMFFRPNGGELNPDFLSRVQKKWPTTTKLVIGCKSGGRSAKACEILVAEGFTSLCNIDGGFLGNPNQAGWHDEGLPCSCCQ